jgi:hypothetical protein
LGAKLSVRRYVGFHPLNTIVKEPVEGKTFEENFEKDSPYILLVSTRYQGLHGAGSEIIVELVDM